MSRTGIVAVSKGGAELARSLAASLAGDNTLYLERRWHVAGDQAEAFDLPLRPVIQRLFSECQRLVLFLPLGAAVRLLAPALEHKHQDPAAVCVDDAGRFAVSLLSGHVGGADRLTEEVAQILGATPVITSASHVGDTLAVDLLGLEFGWSIHAPAEVVTRASAAVVNGEPVGLYQEAGEPHWWPPDRPLPNNISRYLSLESLAAAPCVAGLVITDLLGPTGGKGGTFQELLAGKFVVIYRPRSLAVGMGCRRGVPAQELEELLSGTFEKHNLALDSLYCIATADLKRDEPGILELAEKFGVAVRCYSGEDLNRVFEDQPSGTEAAGELGASSLPGVGGTGATPSPVAHRLLGVWGVSEPAALLASGSGELLVPREKTARATIAVARRVFDHGGG